MDYLLLFLQSALSVFGIRAAYEQPKFDVLGRLAGGVEVRQYGPRLAAETTVTAADEDAGRGSAFEVLAAYIFGANRAAGRSGAGRGVGRKIAMTVPVQVAGATGDKIARAAPVRVESAGGGPTLTMRFFLPSKLNDDTAPVPSDARVKVVTVPPETVAVLRFNGSWDPARLGAKEKELLGRLDGSPWQAAGEPYTLFYDPPFTIPLLRRNELVVPVVRRAE